MTADIPKLGTLARVNLRDVWASEPTQFTPWLAEQENLQALARAIGLPPLELVQTEAQSSEFYVDIVARIAGSDEIVVIENQLTRTDHTHLGQSITYGAGAEAVAIVWVAPAFAEGHRAALDWLNRKTSDDVAFFGVEIEAWRIGDSLPAPKFNVVVRPNRWAREVREEAKAGETANPQNIAYWEAFNTYADSSGVRRAKAAAVKGPNYYYYLSKKPEVAVTAYISRGKTPKIGAYLGMWGAGAEELFNSLQADRAAVESEFGGALEWTQSAPTAFWILISKPADPSSSDDWSAQHAWLAKQMAALKGVFAQRIQPFAETSHTSDP